VKLLITNFNKLFSSNLILINMNSIFIKIFLTVFSMTLCISKPDLKAQDDINLDKYRGVKTENFDLTVKPNQDFYNYVNGTWLKNNPVPSEFSRWGSFIILGEENNKILKAILDNCASKLHTVIGSPEQKIGDIFFTGMDSATIESFGYKPIVPYLDMINSINSKDDLIKVLAYFHTCRLGSLFNFFAGQDKKSSNDVIPQLFQSGLGLPDRDYYTKQDDKSKQIREKYLQHIINYFILTGDNEETAKKQADIIMVIENRLANASMTRTQMREAEATYNKMTLDELKTLTPELNWQIYFDNIGLTDASKFEKGINIGQKDFFKEVNLMINEVSLDDWKIYFKWHLINRTADLLSSQFVSEDFDFSKTLSGAKQIQPRWKRVIQMVNRACGELLGQVYVERMFSPKAKERAKEMVKNILATMNERIQSLIWMSPQTKEAALKKLSTFRVKIGYPDVWRDYTGLSISRESFFENMMRASIFSFNYNLNKIGQPVDREEWGMTPQTVNAYYNAGKNEIVFPAAILQPPFFDADADDALNYGGIGAVIGHEITHGFDEQGRKFDN
jgi:putative endopeptidase